MRRVVVTGLGTLNPVGTTIPQTWEAIVSGKSGIDYITKFDTTEYRSRIGGEVKGFKPENYLDAKDVKRTDLFAALQ